MKEKIALIFLLHENENIRNLILNLPPEERFQILNSLKNLTNINEENVKKTIEAFLSSSRNHFSQDETKAKLLEHIRFSYSFSPWNKENMLLIEKIKNLSNQIEPPVLKKWLLTEHPQVLPFFLTVCPPMVGMALLKSLEAKKRLPIIEKMVTIVEVKKEELQTLCEELEKLISQKTSSLKPNPHKLAQFLNALDPSLKDKIMLDLKDKEKKLYDEIQKNVLTFEQLTLLSQKDLGKLLSEFEDKVLTSICFREKDPLRSQLLQALPQKRRLIIEEEFLNELKIPFSEYEKLKHKILEKAVELEEKKLLFFPWKEEKMV